MTRASSIQHNLPRHVDPTDVDRLMERHIGPHEGRREVSPASIGCGRKTDRADLWLAPLDGHAEVTFGGDQSYSMLPEQSFRARPLSSRLPPPAPVFSPSKLSSSEGKLTPTRSFPVVRADNLALALPLPLATESTRRESLLGGVPLEVQEAMVLRDLLSVLLVCPTRLLSAGCRSLPRATWSHYTGYRRRASHFRSFVRSSRRE
jgi:hypothetical protein